jgi:hypothetical protein
MTSPGTRRPRMSWERASWSVTLDHERSWCHAPWTRYEPAGSAQERGRCVADCDGDDGSGRGGIRPPAEVGLVWVEPPDGERWPVLETGREVASAARTPGLSQGGSAHDRAGEQDGGTAEEGDQGECLDEVQGRRECGDCEPKHLDVPGPVEAVPERRGARACCPSGAESTICGPSSR